MTTPLLKSKKPFLALVALLAGPQVRAAEKSPVGPPFRVNSYTTGAQRAASVALTGAGDTVVITWQSSGQDGSGYGIFGRRVTESSPIGGEFRVNSYTALDQSSPAAAGGLASSYFVVVWQSEGQDGDQQGVFAQRYASAGSPLGAEFRVNTYTTSGQALPDVGLRPSVANGDFVVVWTSAGQDGSADGVFGQRYAASGAPLGPEFQVNTYTTGPQRSASVAVDPNGGFLVVWEGQASNEDGFGVFGQRYASTGAPLGGEFRVNSYTTGHQRYPSAASDVYGQFFVAWQSDGQDGSGLGAYAQLYSNGGAPLTGEFRISAYTTNDQSAPTVWASGYWAFVVTWQSDHAGPGPDVFFEHFIGGTPVDGERRANTYTTGAQTEPSVAYLYGGGGNVVWTSNEDPDGSPGVYAQGYFDFPVELQDFRVE